MDNSESKLIAECLIGDRLAWDVFIDKYTRLVYKYIRHTFSVKSFPLSHEDSAQELFQDIFLSLMKDNCRKLRSFTGVKGCKFATWLRTVVINATLDYMRKNRVLVSLDLENEENQPLRDILPDVSPDAVQWFSKKEHAAQLQQCIENLELEEKFFLELHIEHGWNAQRMMEYLNLSRSAVDVRKSRIVSKLRECFKKKGFI